MKWGEKLTNVVHLSYINAIVLAPAGIGLISPRIGQETQVFHMV